MFAHHLTIISGFRAWRKRKQTAADLLSLDERTLVDIGLYRWQIPLLAAGMPLFKTARSEGQTGRTVSRKWRGHPSPCERTLGELL